MEKKFKVLLVMFLMILGVGAMSACGGQTTTAASTTTSAATSTTSVSAGTTTSATTTNTTSSAVTTQSTVVIPEDTLVDELDSTIAFYRFNEGEGVVIADETGNHDGILVNSTESTWVAGAYGSALNLSGPENQYVQIPNSEDFTPVSLTLELIFKMPAGSQYRTDHRLLFKDGQFDIHLWNPASGNSGIYFMLKTASDPAWTDRITLDGNIYDNQYHHIALTYNGYTGQVNAYFDYQLESSTNIGPGQVLYNDNDLYIGGAYWAGAPQQCSTSIIDAVRISSEQLAPSQFLGSTSSVDVADPGIYGDQQVLAYDFSAQSTNLVRDQYGRFAGELINVSDYETAYTTDEETDLINFDGVNQYLTSSYEEAMMTGDFSLEMSIKLDSEAKTPGDYALVFKDLAYLINIWVNGDDCNVVFKFGVNDKFNQENWITYELFDNQYHHLAMSYDQETGIMTAYIDYNEVFTLSFSEEEILAANFGLDTLYLGAAYWVDALQRPSPVSVDYLKIYNYPLEKEQFTGYVPQQSMIIDYDFSLVDGSTVLDQSGNELNGDMVNCTAVDGAVVVANDRSLSDQGVVVPNSDLFVTQSLSVELLVKMNPEAMSGDHRLIFKDGVFDIHIWVDGTTPKIIPMLVTDDHGWGDIALVECPELFDGEFHHIGFIYDGETGAFTFYIDYKPVAEAALGGSVVANLNNLYIGAAYWGDAFQQGSDSSIKAVRIMNHKILVSEFLGYFDRTDLILDYDFSQVDGTTVLDQSGNGIDAEMINCTTLEDAVVVDNPRVASDQGVKVFNNDLLITNSITVEMVVKMDSTAMSGDHRLIFKDSAYDIHIWVDGTTPKLIPMLGTTTTGWSDLTLYDCTSLFDGEYHHIALTYDSVTGVWTLYVDHVSVGSGTVGGNVITNANDLYIGSAYWAGEFQQGSDASFKQVRIANYVVDVEDFIVLP